MPKISETATDRNPDPRPARTRHALFEALLDLMQEKRWDRIRVQDLLDKTGLGRSTFYAHFDNKFDLLTAAIPDLVLPIGDADKEMPEFLDLFEHVAEVQPLLRAIMSQPLLGEVTETFHRQLAAAWSEHLVRIGLDGAQVTVISELLTGGLLAIFKHWLQAGCERPAGEICADYCRYASAIIAAAT